MNFLDRCSDRFLTAAGVRPGMRILEIGCGDGSLTAIAARLAGPRGQVFGLDRDRDAIRQARVRLAGQRLAANFLEGDFEAAAIDGAFDAVIGRFALSHLRSPADAISKMVGLTAAGGVIAFQEPIVSTCRTVPASKPVEDAVAYVCEAFRASGIEPEAGAHLAARFRSAGLDPALHCDSLVEEGMHGSIGGWLADTCRALSASSRIAPPFRIEACETQWARAIDGIPSIVMGPSVIGAHARTPVHEPSGSEDPEG